MKRFSSEELYEILEYLQKSVDNLAKSEILEFEVLNPDFLVDGYSGNKVEVNGEIYIYRALRVWSDLAQTLFCKMLMPKEIDEKIVVIRYKKLDKVSSFHTLADNKEKYGVESLFFNINKNEEASFLNSYYSALKNVDVKSRKNILNLGINSGDEFDLIKKILSEDEFKELNLLGVDYCESAIEYAKKRFFDKNVTFLCEDITKLEPSKIDKQDLIISIGTLQSSNLNFKTFFSDFVQNYLKKDGAMILGFPNCRWIDSEVIYGAKAPNYSYSEMSILYKDIYFCKKYLQQKKFRVTITGRDYIFLTATSIRKE